MEGADAGLWIRNIDSLESRPREGFHTLPTFLPDGRHFVYFRAGPAETGGVYIGSLEAAPDHQNGDRLLATTRGAAYVRGAAGGRLVFMREGTLMAQPLDEGRLALTGEPVPIAERVGTGPSHGYFSVSPSGHLAYRVGGQAGIRKLTWYDVQGKMLDTVGEIGAYEHLALSPDGTRAAYKDATTAAQRADGRELYFRTVNGTPMAVSVETSPTFQAGIPRRLFALPANVGAWAVTADGKRILAAMPEQQNAQEPITVVLNWEAAVKR